MYSQSAVSAIVRPVYKTVVHSAASHAVLRHLLSSSSSSIDAALSLDNCPRSQQVQSAGPVLQLGGIVPSDSLAFSISLHPRPFFFPVRFLRQPISITSRANFHDRASRVAQNFARLF